MAGNLSHRSEEFGNNHAEVPHRHEGVGVTQRGELRLQGFRDKKSGKQDFAEARRHFLHLHPIHALRGQRVRSGPADQGLGHRRRRAHGNPQIARNWLRGRETGGIAVL